MERNDFTLEERCFILPRVSVDSIHIDVYGEKKDVVLPHIEVHIK